MTVLVFGKGDFWALMNRLSVCVCVYIYIYKGKVMHLLQKVDVSGK